MKAPQALIAVTSLLLAMTPARADVVTDWNEQAVTAGYTGKVGNSQHSRDVAIINIAMFEALNSIDPRFTAYRARLPVAAGASREAAAATAAHTALVKLYPAQAADFDKALQASMATIADGPAREAGRKLGEQAAAAILAERGNDGSTAPNSYRPYTTPGRYVPTLFPLSATWGGVKPFALKSGDQMRPPAPYALASAQWAKDYNEIKAIGGKAGSTRTAEQTEIARFWEQSGPSTYYPVFKQTITAKGLSLLDNARLSTLAAIAAADAAIAVFDAKYAYGFWRPVTALRNGDLDGNDATQPDAGWESFIATPMHPEYPCAHCIFQGAAASVLQSMYGDSVPPFALTSPTAPGVTRRFARLSDYVAEVVNARIYEGVHYRTSGDVGAAMGRQIGEFTVSNLLRPLP